MCPRIIWPPKSRGEYFISFFGLTVFLLGGVYIFLLHSSNLSKNLERRSMGKVAMLLRTDYDHAKGRQHLFGECPIFAKKLVLTRRIVWFDGPNAAFNHAWYIWDWKHVGPPVLAYW
jgi:hypothetical protein